MSRRARMLTWCVAAFVALFMLFMVGAITCSIIVNAPGFSPFGDESYSGLPLDLQTEFRPQLPEWSTDGQTIVVTYRGEVFGISVAGAKSWPVVPQADYAQFSPSLSPNGSVAYETYRTSEKLFEEPIERFIETAPLDGSGEVERLYELAKSERGPARPTWSPDGSRIAFIARNLVRQPDKLVVTTPEGEVEGEYVPTPVGRGFMKRIVWSNDGRRIAVWHHDFGLRGVEYGAVTTVRADGSGESRIIDETKGTVSPPEWSLEDARIYFAIQETDESLTEASNSARLLSVSNDGADPDVILDLGSDSTGWFRDIRLSPTGTQLLYHVAQGYLQTELYMANTDGTGLKKLGSGHIAATWSPDGRQVAVFDLEIGQLDLLSPSPEGIDRRVLYQFETSTQQ